MRLFFFVKNRTILRGQRLSNINTQNRRENSDKLNSYSTFVLEARELGHSTLDALCVYGSNVVYFAILGVVPPEARTLVIL